MKNKLFSVIGIGAFLFGSQAAWAALPKMEGPVNDLAGVLAPEAEQAIKSRIRAVEAATTAEIAVVTVRSLEGETVETYANRLFNQWGIGKKGKDNGVLILAAIEDRKIRIEVGYGLEGTLPDGRCGQIIRMS